MKTHLIKCPGICLHYPGSFIIACMRACMCACVCVLFPHLHVHISPVCLALWLSVPRHAVTGPLHTDTCQQVNTAPHSMTCSFQQHSKFQESYPPPTSKLFPPRIYRKQNLWWQFRSYLPTHTCQCASATFSALSPTSSFLKIGKTCPSLY